MSETPTRPNVPKIACPKCGEWLSKVRDGRPDPRGYRRKRVCQNPACKQVYYTIERAASVIVTTS